MNWIGLVAFLVIMLTVCILDVRYARRQDALPERETDAAKDVASIWPSCDISSLAEPHEGVTATMSVMTQQAPGDPPEPEPTPPITQQPGYQPVGDYAAFRRDLEECMRQAPHVAFSSQETFDLFGVHLKGLQEIQQIRQFPQAGQLRDQGAGSEAEE